MALHMQVIASLFEIFPTFLYIYSTCQTFTNQNIVDLNSPGGSFHYTLASVLGFNAILELSNSHLNSAHERQSCKFNLKVTFLIGLTPTRQKIEIF